MQPLQADLDRLRQGTRLSVIGCFPQPSTDLADDLPVVFSHYQMSRISILEVNPRKHARVPCRVYGGAPAWPRRKTKLIRPLGLFGNDILAGDGEGPADATALEL